MAKLLCPECGYEFDGNRPACPECGCPASECVSVNDNRQQENETKPSAPSHSPVQNRMGNLNTCRECGHQISIDAKRCPQCGAKGIYAPLDYGDSIYDCFCRKFAKFSGRSRRSEVFPFFVCVLFIWLILSFGYPTLAYIFLLITAIPWFAAVARRLHDIGRNGWWVNHQNMTQIMLQKFCLIKEQKLRSGASLRLSLSSSYILWLLAVQYGQSLND